MQDYKTGNEKMSQLLNEWYCAIRALQTKKSIELKKEVDVLIGKMTKKNTDLLLHYSLLNFRYKILTDDLGVRQNSFDSIDALSNSDDKQLSYYYHLFKAMHYTVLTEYNDAKEHYEKAGVLLEHMHDELETAEFFYRLSAFNYQIYEPLLALKYSDHAKELFSKQMGCELNIASCENVYGLACVDLKQYGMAEETFNSAINILNKSDETKLILRVRSNLGWLYASQNLSELAIRQLTEVIKHIPNHYKAIFSEAEAYYNLGEKETASKLIEQGLAVCLEFGNVEYLHRFRILQGLNDNVLANELEYVVQEGISYFKREQLLECIQEYTEKLAAKFYDECNPIKASEYFHQSTQVRKKYSEKGALK
ncbi:hypothetical protein M3Y14_17645 [Bacillus thuringiensis]|uniref:response regulator aspartate phosphatase n=1 Tax=Bacillus thuringiensis TaxID=1428 RepID=UPI002225A7D1|nr:hypothetical protein [Bacillus thuringiensis]UYX50381.1 hypothetical protein M3Y14_17645 [Bacillus thuringiensis]